MSVNVRNLITEDESEATRQTVAEAVNTINPGGAEHRGQAAAEEPEEIEIDPQLLAQAVQNKNARLIAMMVHENAMLEVALEQERRARQDAEAKYDALQASLAD